VFTAFIDKINMYLSTDYFVYYAFVGNGLSSEDYKPFPAYFDPQSLKMKGLPLYLPPALRQGADVGLIRHHGVVFLYHVHPGVIVDRVHYIDNAFNVLSRNVLPVRNFQTRGSVIRITSP
jgi:hypothetical protein